MSTYKASNQSQACSHQGCDCRSDQFGGVEKGDSWFCSQGCAEGSGCDHAGCDCNSVKNHDPDLVRSGEPTVPGAPTKPFPKRNPGQHVDHNPAQGSPATRRGI